MNFNNQKIRFREFHINEFPQDRIFVCLEENFHRKLFEFLKKRKFEDFNRIFFNDGLNYHTFKQWIKRKHFMPLWFILQLSEKFQEFSTEEFEKNINAMKGPSASAVIGNPELPLKEDGRLMKIIAHLLGDGSVGGGFGSNFPKGKQHSEYRNFNFGLLDSFERDLSVFGEVPTTTSYTHGSVIIPNLIGYVLQHIYKIKFDCFNSRVPEALFNLPKELVASFLRAFGDDEGHVCDSSIDYYSNNKNLLTDILNLMNKKFPEIEISSIKANSKTGKNTKYSLTILNRSQEAYLELIGFDSAQKTEDLIFNIERKNRWNPHIDCKRNYTGQRILDTLKEENMTAKQISRKMIMRHSNVLHYLKKLHKQGKIEVVRKEHWANVWKIN